MVSKDTDPLNTVELVDPTSNSYEIIIEMHD